MILLAALQVSLGNIQDVIYIYEVFKEGPLKYGILNLIDGRFNTALVIDPIGGKGGGATIIFPFEWCFDEIRIYNGFQSDERIFREYGRSREIGIGLFPDYRTFVKEFVNEKSIYLEDKKEVQIYKFSRPQIGKVLDISVAVYNAYPGTKIKYPAISEIEFYYKGKKVDLGPIEELKKSYVKAFIKEVKWYLSYTPGKIIKRRWKSGCEYEGWDPDKVVYEKEILVRPDGVLEWRIYDRETSLKEIEERFGTEFMYRVIDWMKEHDLRWPQNEGEVSGGSKGREICRILEEGKGLWKFDGEGRLWFKIGNKWEHVDYEITAWDKKWEEKFKCRVEFVIYNTKLKGAYFGDKLFEPEDEW